jgi:hypothetical protein
MSVAKLAAAPLNWAFRHHFRYGGMVIDAITAMMARATANSKAVSPDSLKCMQKLLYPVEQN